MHAPSINSFSAPVMPDSPLYRLHGYPPKTAPPSTNPLTSILRRLEAATSRLEDIATSAAPFDPQSATSIAASPAAASTQSALPEAASTAKDGSSTPHAATPAPVQLPPTVSAMDELIDTEGNAFLEASKGIDPLVEQQAAAVAKAFADQRRFLVTTTKAKKPDLTSPQTFNHLLKDLQQDMGAVGDIRDSNRGSPMKEHLAMAGEGIGALQWLLMEGKPADFVGEVIGGAQMYGNRVLKAYKET